MTRSDHVGYQLSFGPQDGAWVIGREIPRTIYVGPKWLGDGFVSWGRERCERFPCCYVLEGLKYTFRNFKSP